MAHTQDRLIENLSHVSTARFELTKQSPIRLDNGWQKRKSFIVESLRKSGYEFEVTETDTYVLIVAERIGKAPAVRPPAMPRYSNTPLTLEQCKRRLAEAKKVWNPDDFEQADIEYWQELVRLATERELNKRRAVAIAA